MNKCYIKSKLLCYMIVMISYNTIQFAQVNIGVLGGVNSTTFNGDSPPKGSYTSGYGYNIGGIFDVYLFEDIAINLQPMYSHNATFISYDVNYQYEKFDSISIKTEYVEIPINVKIVADNKITYVNAGVSLAHLLDAQAKNQRSGDEAVIEELFESYTLRANFGVGVKFSIGLPILFFELNYSQSLTNITKDTILNNEIDRKLKSNGFRLYTGVMLKL